MSGNRAGHEEGKQDRRVRPMRRFKATATASTFCRGHALIRNLGRGFSPLAAGATPCLRLAPAWAALAAML